MGALDYNHNSFTGPSYNKPTGGIQSKKVLEIVEKFEVESDLPLSANGNLKHNIKFWKSIGAPYYILSIIENGYKLPSPEPVKLRNNKSARLHAEFVDQAIHELSLSGCICAVAQKPLVVNPLSVSIQTSSKKRLILTAYIISASRDFV